jgi:imidazole glycerol-phosphate synthase subunit HisH
VGADARLVTDADEAAEASGVVLPGVGAFGPCADALHRSGLHRAAHDAVSAGRPFLGICVGLQLMYEGSEESPGVAGLGIVEGEVRRLPEGVKHPQMQWNRLEPVPGGQRSSQLLAAVGPDAWTYFVHSYAPPPGPDVVAICDYGGPVVAAVERGVAWGVQFHPEKSAEAGLRLLSGFVELCRREEAP